MSSVFSMKSISLMRLRKLRLSVPHRSPLPWGVSGAVASVKRLGASGSLRALRQLQGSFTTPSSGLLYHFVMVGQSWGTALMSITQARAGHEVHHRSPSRVDEGIMGDRHNALTRVAVDLSEGTHRRINRFPRNTVSSKVYALRHHRRSRRWRRSLRRSSIHRVRDPSSVCQSVSSTYLRRNRR